MVDYDETESQIWQEFQDLESVKIDISRFRPLLRLPHLVATSSGISTEFQSSRSLYEVVINTCKSFWDETLWNVFPHFLRLKEQFPRMVLWVPVMLTMHWKCMDQFPKIFRNTRVNQYWWKLTVWLDDFWWMFFRSARSSYQWCGFGRVWRGWLQEQKDKVKSVVKVQAHLTSTSILICTVILRRERRCDTAVSENFFQLLQCQQKW